MPDRGVRVASNKELECVGDRLDWSMPFASAVDNDRADRSVEIAVFRAFVSRAPGRVDRADEVETGIALRWQRDGHLTLAELAFGFERFFGHDSATLVLKWVA